MIDENKESESRTTTINFSEEDVKKLSINGNDIQKHYGSTYAKNTLATNILATNTPIQVLDTIDAFGYAVNNIVEQESTALKSRLIRIQEQIGCPIGIFFKALKYGILVKTSFWQGKIHHVEAVFLNGDFCFRSAELLGIHIECLPLKEFNKTWWVI